MDWTGLNGSTDEWMEAAPGSTRYTLWSATCATDYEGLEQHLWGYTKIVLVAVVRPGGLG